MFSIIALFYFWTALTSAPPDTPAAARSGYSALLANAFLAGQLNLLVEPDPRLLELPDPYNPEQNAPYRLHDAALFHGKYYLYFGPSPALFIFAPYKLLTGADLPEFAAIALFCSAGLLFSVLLLRLLLSYYLPNTPYWLFLAGVLALGFGNVAPFLLRRPAIYEVAISYGYASVFASIYFFASGALGKHIKLGRLALGSLFLGIAAGARFPMLAAGLVPFALAVYLFSQSAGAKVRSRFLLVLALAGPAALCLFSLGVYNYLRFDSWTQFGMVYTLTGLINQNHYRLFNPARIPIGIFYYMFVPPHFVPWFPFLQLNGAFYLAPPADYYLEPVAGLLTISPLVCILFCLPFLSRKLWRTHRRLWIVLSVLISVGLLLLTLFSSLSGTMRYEVDFAGFFLLSALLLWYWCFTRLASAPKLRLLLVSAFLLCLLVTVSFNVALSFTGYSNLLKESRPETYAAIRSFFHPLEESFGVLDNPKLVSPAPGSVLSGTPVVFRWDPVPGAEDYWVDVGTALGQGNLHRGFTHGATSVSLNLSHYMDGRTIHVQLFSKTSRIAPVAGMGNQFQLKTAPAVPLTR